MHAVWRPNEPVERSLLRWVFRRWKRLSKVLKVLSVLPGMALYLMATASSPQSHLLLILVSAAVSCFVATLCALQPGFSSYDSGEILTNDPPPAVEVDVDLIVERPGVLIGEDTGRLTVIDGWLLFTGHRTTFSFQSQHCKSLNWKIPNFKGFPLARRHWAVIEVTGPESLTVQLRHQAARDEETFDVMIARWKQVKSTGDVVPVFPPKHPHPEAWRLHLTTVCAKTLVLFFFLLAIIRSPSETTKAQAYDSVLAFVGIPCLIAFHCIESYTKLSNIRLFQRQARQAAAIGDSARTMHTSTHSETGPSEETENNRRQAVS